MKELQSRGHSTTAKSKTELQEKLAIELKGIQRPPSFFTAPPYLSDLVQNYEIPPCEPLHDITNIVQNLITEIPCHIDDQSTQKEFEQFSTATIGDKSQRV